MEERGSVGRVRGGGGSRSGRSGGGVKMGVRGGTTVGKRIGSDGGIGVEGVEGGGLGGG